MTIKVQNNTMVSSTYSTVSDGTDLASIKLDIGDLTIDLNSTYPTYPTYIDTIRDISSDITNSTVNGRKIGQVMEAIEDRLAIIYPPDPEKLEKYKSLKKAYDHYKLIEKLIREE